MKQLKTKTTKIKESKIERLPEMDLRVEDVPWKTQPQITPQQIQQEEEWISWWNYKSWKITVSATASWLIEYNVCDFTWKLLQIEAMRSWWSSKVSSYWTWTHWTYNYDRCIRTNADGTKKFTADKIYDLYDSTDWKWSHCWMHSFTSTWFKLDISRSEFEVDLIYTCYW